MRQLKNFIFHEINHQPHVFRDPVLQKKGIDWLRIGQEFVEGQWQIILNNVLILVAMSVVGWEFHNFIAIQFLDILILAFISVFYNIVIQNKMSLLPSFVFKFVSIILVTVSLVLYGFAMCTLLDTVYTRILKIDDAVNYSDHIDLPLMLIGISFFISRTYLFLKGFMQNNHYKNVTSVDLLKFFVGKAIALMSWGILVAAYGSIMLVLGLKNAVIFIVGCVGVKMLVEMAHMYILRKVSPKLVGILYPIRSL